MKKFFTAQDIEDLHKQNKLRLVIDEDTVLTAAAQEMARQLGIALAHEPVPAVPSFSLTEEVALVGPGSSNGSNGVVPSKPKGCLRSGRPVETAGFSNTSGASYAKTEYGSNARGSSSRDVVERASQIVSTLIQDRKIF